MRLDREQSLDVALGQIERQFGKGSVMRMNDAAQVATGAVSTGSLSLDLALGVGGLPRGRIVEKSMPTPPPCCMVRAASPRCSKMPARLSGIVPITKQLNRVTVRPVPAPDRIRPAGMKRKSAIAS